MMLIACAAFLGACGSDPGDPAAIARDFVVGVMAGDADDVRDLTCAEWRETTTAWAAEGTRGLEVDTDHLVFEVGEAVGGIVPVVVRGVMTLRTDGGVREVRALEGEEALRFTLVDEDGWKVCGLETGAGLPTAPP